MCAHSWAYDVRYLCVCTCVCLSLCVCVCACLHVSCSDNLILYMCYIAALVK